MIFCAAPNPKKCGTEHKELKTYGIGADISKPDWQRYLRELTGQGLLKVTDDVYPILTLTPKSDAVLKGLQKVLLVKRETVEEHHQPVPRLYLSKLRLLNELKDTRRMIAQNENVPPYIILSDATLMEMATYLPQSLDELRLISGFGDVKLARYGREFLAACKSL